MRNCVKKISAPSATSAVESLRFLLRDPSIASKNWVYRQYDHMVRTGTVVRPGSDAAVFHLREANKFLAATTDCNSLYCRLDPREGGRIAVAEAARNLACSGAVPLADDRQPQLRQSLQAGKFLAAARGGRRAWRRPAASFATPVIGGNVSLYNESPAGVVDPTPTVAMVGLIEREEWITTQYLQGGRRCGHLARRLRQHGRSRGRWDPGSSLGATHYLKVIHGRKTGRPPRLDFARELAVQNTLRELIRAGHVRSAHDCSEGGLAVALAEACFNPAGSLGAKIDLSAAGEDPARLQILFNESQSRIVISTVPENADAVLQSAQLRGIPAHRLGTVGGDELRITLADEILRWPLREIHDDWYYAIANAVGEEPGTS